MIPKTSEKFEEAYAKLNPAQKAAVDTIDGPVMVVAGPGAGKTEILSLRVANILRRTDMSPSNILCLTFTDSAAVNMRKRLSGLMGNTAYRVAISTFHSFGTDIIHSFPEHFFGGASLLPSDSLASIKILENIFSELPHSDSLSSLYEGTFAYLSDTQSAISHLKKGGLSPAEFRAVLDQNAKVFDYANQSVGDAFAERISKKSFEKAHALVKTLRDFKTEEAAPLVRSLNIVAAESLERAIEASEETEKTTPLSEWKKEWTEKNDDGASVLKGTNALPKLLSLGAVYERYQKDMRTAGYYDFDDMILDVIHSLEENASLRYELQERYQYILVDEFQDTNDGQMRLVRLLTDAPVHEGRPNIMVVGDDDQAVYKFQGAEISNILSFRDMFRDTALITMTENYRSTQEVLDLARHVILKGEERLENKIPEIVKELKAGNKNLAGGAIVRKTFPTRTHEFRFIASEIRRLLDSGVSGKDIAVIGRKHKNLEALTPFLMLENIPVNYERRQNVFEEPHIRELILLSRFITSLTRKNKEEADELLPEILSFPFWGISRKTIWGISIEAERSRAKRMRWLDVMLASTDEKVRALADFFLDLAERSHNETLEEILDEMMGSEFVSTAFSEDEDIEAKPETVRKFQSPFKEYYFSRENFEKNKAQFLTFLSSLRVFVGALREYKQGTLLRVSDLVEFVDLHEKNNIRVSDTSPFVSGTDAVTLLSAHKAKGLEFDTVFTLSCQDEVWAGRGMSSKLPFPKNLLLAPAGDTLDDKLRLFYVALTRAKRHLYMTSYEMGENGKESLPLQFLVDAEFDGEANPAFAKGFGEAKEEKPNESILFDAWKAVLAPPFIADEQALLRSLLDEYQMSVTHLNNFLDVTRGGPQTFLEHNLLRFPQAKSPSGGYGSAMHGTIEKVYTFLRRTGDMPETEEIFSWFEEGLLHERLSSRDHKHFLKQGHDALYVYFKERGERFDPAHKIEVDFKNQGVILGEARITGKIDKMIPEGDEMRVVDFKTGKTFDEWETSRADEKVKLYKYRRQLIFYKILVENSRDYNTYKVNEGALEFLEPDKQGRIHELAAEITEEETKRTKRLVEAVYAKIIALDLPDTSGYAQDLEGLKQFEDDLLL
jgi:DNA helicase-2/ATP-dependent DNA helicase PcrA